MKDARHPRPARRPGERSTHLRRSHRAQAIVVILLAVVMTWFTLAAMGDAPEDEPARTAPAGGEAVTVTGPQEPPRPIVRFTVGAGSRSADIVRRAGSSGPQPVVIFLHGWGIVGRGAYRPWIRHLAAMGNTVIVPRYQRNARADPGRVRGWALAGIRRAFARVTPAPGTLIVAGHSAGAALAADYAAIAGAQGLPRPVGVFAVYPGRAIRGYPGGVPEADLSRVPARTWVTVLAGTNDTVVGRAPAERMTGQMAQVPLARRRLVLVAEPGASDHLGPTRAGSAARRAFWRRLDRFITRARP